MSSRVQYVTPVFTSPALGGGVGVGPTGVELGCEPKVHDETAIAMIDKPRTVRIRRKLPSREFKQILEIVRN